MLKSFLCASALLTIAMAGPVNAQEPVTSPSIKPLGTDCDIVLGRAKFRHPANSSAQALVSLLRKSRYFRLAVANYERAEATENPKLKAKFMEIAARYRDLALEIDDAEWRHGELIASNKS